MKKILPLLLLFAALTGKSQLLTWSPDFIKETTVNNSITMDANYGNKAMLGYASSVYVHIGVITSLSTSSADWKYVKFTWATSDVNALCTSLGSSKWRFTIAPNLRTFFGITNSAETIKKISILFRSADGNTVQRNTDASDMYVPVYDDGVYARIDVPFKQPTYNPIPETIIKNINDPLTITAKSTVAGTLNIYFNSVSPIATTSLTTLTTVTTITTGGNQQIIAEAKSGISTGRDTINFVVSKANTVADLPAGTQDGINYETGDTSAILVMYGPGKKNVYAIGDFNNWINSDSYQFNITPDSKRFWKRITGLKAGQEYAYQFLIDGYLRLADPYCEKVLDPNNDPYISSTIYPNLKPYPTGKTTGIVSVLQTKKAAYNWQVTNFAKPDKRNLLIYELLIRDFSAKQSWQGVMDSLPYLKRLGINAIEVMPFNEFEGNNSWGYNPSFYLAPDKAYGTEVAVKGFIDECHKNGIAVIMDVAFNHSFYLSPMVQEYWDAANSRPAADNPWFNAVPKHAYNVGYDMNHESQPTIDLVNSFIKNWLVNYKIDGFRWDLSKGFTQKQTCDNNGANCDVGAWSAYDASRVVIWKRYYDFMQAASAGSYCILEHLGDNGEEKDLANYGMMPWGNLNYSYSQATQGYSSDFSYGISANRGYTNPFLVTYQESHDEERLMYSNKTYGNSSGTYNVKTISTGLARCGMATAFWATEPGPKMLYEFDEIGYDYSINTCTDGTIKNECRLDSKPVRWDYYQDPTRKNLYDVYSKLFALRNKSNYLSTFTTGTINYNLSGSVKWQNIVSDSLKVMVYGNFGVVSTLGSITFPATGTWYNYLGDGQINVNSLTVTVNLQPGDYFVYTNKNIKGSVLPLNWLSFAVRKADNKSVLLSWVTGNEINNDHFEIERSRNGIDFTSIAAMPANKNAQAQNKYSYTDNFAVSGTNYYRIKQVDKDGQYSYSSTEKVDMNDIIRYWKIYPNPAISHSGFYANDALAKVELSVADMNGKIIWRTNATNISAGQRIDINLSNASKGIYILKINTDKGNSTEKIIVE